MHHEPVTEKDPFPWGNDVSGAVAARRSAIAAVGPFAPGTTIGGAYEIRGVLGAGGMGVVYEAFDRGLARRVAIKAALGGAFASSLRAEAHTLAALRSPSFVEVYALGCHDGIDFLVMELLHGERLDRRIDEAVAEGALLPLSEVVHALIGLARALRDAHRAAVSQRDVKPSNTMVGGERVVLFDFGFAMPEVFVEDPAELCGSIDYLAPELILGRVRRGEGALVDLYALGICAYELLTNRTPFGGNATDRTLSQHLTEEPRDVREIRRDVPDDLALLVCGLLQKDPNDRPSSAEAVLWQLEMVKSHLDGKAQRPISVPSERRESPCPRAQAGSRSALRPDRRRDDP